MNKVFIIALQDETDGVNSLFNIPVFYCGVGKVNAAIKTSEVINLGFNKIINIGSCGSSKYPIGTILKIGRVFQDIDASPICKYGETPFETDSESLFLSADSDITCFTTDYFYDNNQIDKYSKFYLEKIKNCSVVDMECFSIAKTCKHKNVEFVSYKWVSDGGELDEWKKNCRIGLKNFQSDFLSNI
jgi:adenosylhomocysteine nucleosidase